MLSDLPAETKLAAEPSQMWLVVALEIVVEVDTQDLDDDDRHYLLLTQRTYGTGGAGDEAAASMSRIGHWVPPTRSFPISLGYRMSSTVGAVEERFQEVLGKLDLMSVAEQLGHSLGLRDPDYQHAGSLTESKPSPRRAQHNCYRIERFSVIERSQRALVNIADPEGRKAHIFLPLRSGDPAVKSASGDGAASSSWSFLARPVVSNIGYLLADESRMARLKARATRIDPQAFAFHEQGVVLCLDLAGYGGVLRFVENSLHSLDQRGADIARQLRYLASSAFNQFLAELGATHIHLAGDGFICALPLRNADVGTAGELMDSVMVSYRALIGEISELNQALEKARKAISREAVDTPQQSPTEHQLGSRLAIHWGDYSFGRVGLARNLVVGFDGATIIEVARLEAGLRELTKGPLISDGKPLSASGASEWPHTIIVSKAAKDVAGGFFEDYLSEGDASPLEFIQEACVGVKESEVQGTVYGYDPSSSRDLLTSSPFS